MALSGVPYWTTDAGGFRFGNRHDPEFQEVEGKKTHFYYFLFKEEKKLKFT